MIMRYSLRFFYSKGASLVLLWGFSEAVVLWSFLRLYSVLFQGIQKAGWYSQLAMIPAVPFLTSAPLAGWLADSKLGNFKVFKFCAVLLFLAAVLASVCTQLLTSFPAWSFVLSSGVAPLAYSVGFIGLATYTVTALQLGLDQMPDASSSNTVSFISWFLFSMLFGAWSCETVWTSLYFCAHNKISLAVQVFSLFPVLSTSIVCCTIFLLAPKWPTIEPKSPQALKNIYQVLKFAAKHKTALNRSAFTYWEEERPSRLDLGKSKYGGPFTTEQVEDVKTFFKILVMPIPWFIVASVFQPKLLNFIDGPTGTLRGCNSALLYTFTYNPTWCAMLLIVVTEFVLYPLVRQALPSTLKCIGFTSFLVLATSVVYLTVYIIRHFYPFQLTPWISISYSVYYGPFNLFSMVTLAQQFVCAQSPYNMRGLLTGYFTFMYGVSLGLGTVVFYLLGMLGENGKIVQWSVAVLLSLLGFILHCLLARWYKMRVRDEEYNVYRVVEEVYERYLSGVDRTGSRT